MSLEFITQGARSIVGYGRDPENHPDLTIEVRWTNGKPGFTIVHDDPKEDIYYYVADGTNIEATEKIDKLIAQFEAVKESLEQLQGTKPEPPPFEIPWLKTLWCETAELYQAELEGATFGISTAPQLAEHIGREMFRYYKIRGKV